MLETQPAVLSILDDQARDLRRAAVSLVVADPASLQRYLTAVESIHAETLDRIRALAPEQLLVFSPKDP